MAKISKSGKITGFHQDRMGFYRNLGLLKDVEMHGEGFYKAKVFIGGEWIERSFFPEQWITEDLMNCYYEVINDKNIVKCNALRTTFEFERRSEILITAVIENDGYGVTFFPNLL